MMRIALRSLKPNKGSNIRIKNINTCHDEYQYLNLITDVLENGELVSGRNGNVKTIIGSSMRFDLSEGRLPLLTTKKVAWKTCLKELLWFIRGQTDNDILKSQNVKIWDGNASREFLDSRGLTHYREGDLGPVYGHQWRHFNATYSNCNEDYSGKGIDQLSRVINMLDDPNKRNSRRMVISAWNPCQIQEMALPPCHIMMQFNVLNNKLYCSVYQRSADVGLGVPFNIASYSILTHLLAHHVGLGVGDLNHHLGNVHIYDDHFEPLLEQSKRKPLSFPTLRINRKLTSIEDYEVNDFSVDNYKCHSPIKMKMRE